MSLSERSSLENLADVIDAEEVDPNEFLEAWKCAVNAIGSQYFSVTADTVASADSKWELRPDLLVVEKSLLVLSSGERVFLIGLCQFYCDSDIKFLCQKQGIDVPSLTDYSNLDFRYRSILVRLMNSYTGW